MTLTIDKFVCNVMTVPNPTQYTKFDKYKIKTQKSRLFRNVSEIKIPRICLLICARGPGRTAGTGARGVPAWAWTAHKGACMGPALVREALGCISDKIANLDQFRQTYVFLLNFDLGVFTV